jgi:hypothetical protein
MVATTRSKNPGGSGRGLCEGISRHLLQMRASYEREMLSSLDVKLRKPRKE